jgi:2-oxoisovalerate dehydrogenase E1 component
MISAERGTPVIPIQVPAIGEGLEEARILKYFKQPGERVRRDDLIYQLETDKAVVDVEAPGEGVLTAWEAPVNATVPVGAVIGHLQVEGGAVAAAAPGEAVAAVARPEGTARAVPEGAHGVAVPATVFQKADWSVIQAAREQAREAADSAVMTSFAFAAWAVMRALTKHEVFRSSLPRHSLLRIYKHVHLGMAVALADGDLTTAVLDNADTHTLPDFCRRLRDQVERARKGEDQARQHASVIITSLTALHVLDAIPVIVPPAMATLAVSSPFVECYLQDGAVRERPMVNLSLTIDHRVVNGVGAAAFLNDVKAEIEGFRLPS